MEKGKSYFIDCTKRDYPFVRDKLTEMGFSEQYPFWSKYSNGVVVLTDLCFYPYVNPSAQCETLTLEQFKQQHNGKN